MPSTSSLPRIPGRIAAKHYPSLAAAIRGAREQLRADRAVRSATARGISTTGEIVEVVVRSVHGPARRRVLAVVG